MVEFEGTNEISNKLKRRLSRHLRDANNLIAHLTKELQLVELFFIYQRNIDKLVDNTLSPKEFVKQLEEDKENFYKRLNEKFFREHQ